MVRVLIRRIQTRSTVVEIEHRRKGNVAVELEEALKAAKQDADNWPVDGEEWVIEPITTKGGE